jgi:transcriptional regulator with PAS, ATPase and Fis domain
VDVRIIAATSGNLPAKLAAGEFRENLYYRLNVITVHLPPLRARADDIRLLAEHFLNRSIGKSKPIKKIRGFTAPAMQLLESYHWPGNIRELENVIERAVTLALPEDELITPELLPAAISGVEFPQRAMTSGEKQSTLSERLDLLERRMILEALEQHAGNRTQAAKSLGIPRSTLILKMKKHAL